MVPAFLPLSGLIMLSCLVLFVGVDIAKILAMASCDHCHFQTVNHDRGITT